MTSPFPNVNCSVAVLVWRPKHQTRQSHGHRLPQTLPAIRSMRSRHGESGANGFRQNAQAVLEQICSTTAYKLERALEIRKSAKYAGDKLKMHDTVFTISRISSIQHYS